MHKPFRTRRVERDEPIRIFGMHSIGISEETLRQSEPRTKPFALDHAQQQRASLTRFKARAAIDWLELEIETESPTNFHAVQRRLRTVLGCDRRPRVDALDEQPGGAATRFSARIQDPPSRVCLWKALDELSAIMPLTGVPRLRELEVAVDFYSKAQDRRELEAMVLRLKHGIAAEGDLEIESGGLTTRVENIREFRPDRTLLIKQDVIAFRVYLKDRDAGIPIENPDLHRARVETTLPGSSLPRDFGSIDRSGQVRFEALTPFFAFRRLIPESLAAPQPPLTAADHAHRRRLDLVLGRGHRELPPPARRDRRKHHLATRADSELKERIRDALRDLSRRFTTENPERSLR